MNLIKRFSILGLAVALGAVASAQAVEVDFVEADKFTDFTASPTRADAARESYMKELTRYLESRLDKEIAPGHHVHVVITDIDMAGEFEPWRRGGFEDVRIVKDLYPPRIDLSFRVVDEAGNVILEGDRKLRDLAFMYTGRPLDSDPLRHEKELLGNWVRKEFKRYWTQA